MTEARIPTSEKENGPSTLKHTHELFGCCSSGTLSAAQTMETSSSVRVTELKTPLQAQSGIRAPADKRHTANFPGIRENRKARPLMSFSSASKLRPGCSSVKQIQKAELLFRRQERSFERITRQLA
jgi:hypothetical protein